MDLFAPAEAPAAPALRERDQIPDRFKWNLTKIFPDWDAWQAAYDELDRKIAAFAGLQGTLGERRRRALLCRADAARRDRPARVQGLVLRVALLRPGSARQPDQREAPAGADPVREGGAGVGLVRSRAAARSRWRPCRRGWREQPTLAVYRFAHRGSLPPAGARARRQGRAAAVAVEPVLVVAATTRMRRCRPPTSSIRRSRCRAAPRSTLTYGQYRAILATNRNQADRAAAFHAFHKIYEANVNTYASLYNGVLQRDWFHAQARGYATTLDAALHGNNIPTGGRREPDRADQGGRRAAAPLSPAAQARARPRRPTTRTTRRFRWSSSIGSIRTTTCSSGCRRRWRRSAPTTSGRCARSSTGSASTCTRTRASGAARIRRRCTACQPYMLLNYNDTLDAVFTLAHEMGHSMHTVLSHAHQPFVYAGYTIFVAEVPSTLSEALFLDYMLGAHDRRARAHRAAAARHRRHRRRRSTRR